MARDIVSIVEWATEEFIENVLITLDLDISDNRYAKLVNSISNSVVSELNDSSFARDRGYIDEDPIS